MTDNEKMVREVLASCQERQKIKFKRYGREAVVCEFTGWTYWEEFVDFNNPMKNPSCIVERSDGYYTYLISGIESVEKVE